MEKIANAVKSAIEAGQNQESNKFKYIKLKEWSDLNVKISTSNFRCSSSRPKPRLGVENGVGILGKLFGF